MTARERYLIVREHITRRRVRRARFAWLAAHNETRPA